MSDDVMADEPSFRCPACRARQPLREECRRCQADLSLMVRAHRRVHYLMCQQQQARATGDQQLDQGLAAELQLLAPRWS
jgi:hypothetical protein